MEQIRIRDKHTATDFLLKAFFHETSPPKPLKITLGSFAAGVNDTGNKLPPVSTTPAANWPQIMGTLSKC
jgi:hypothetical protein